MHSKNEKKKKTKVYVKDTIIKFLFQLFFSVCIQILQINVSEFKNQK